MPAPRIFDLAAKAFGYDPALACDAEAARHDHRVWDLAEQYQREVNDAAVTA